MAELTASRPTGGSASNRAGTTPDPATPKTSQQLRAIAWLRWRILANGFRRKGGAGELIARIVILPVFALFALFPTLAAGFLAFTFTRHAHLDRLSWILWGAFALTQVLNINLGQPGTTFDPLELIRFPIPLGRWVLMRLCFGLLSPSNLVVSLVSAAVVVGIAAASPRLLVPALGAMLVFALTNILFTRMIFAWVDRWLSTRRARELFTAFVFLLSLGFQALNAHYNPGFQHGHHHRDMSQANVHYLQRLSIAARPFSPWLPPGLTADSIQCAADGNPAGFLLRTALCAGFAALFLWIYFLRMRTEFRGENLSESANLTQAATKTHPASASLPSHAVAQPTPAARNSLSAWFPPTLAPLLNKELLILRRNTGLFYGLVAPAVMVFLFAGRLSSRGGGSEWVPLAAVAYALIGVAPMGFNSLGTEGTGAQFYFMAPVPLREVFFAKNVFLFAVALAEAALVLTITGYVAGRPSVSDCFFALLWIFGTLLLSMAVGNRRSVSAPRKVNPGRTFKKAQSPLSAYMSVGIMLGCTAFGFGCQLLGVFLDRRWVGTVLIFAFAVVSALVYDRVLNGIEAYALERRDILFEELGRKS